MKLTVPAIRVVEPVRNRRRRRDQGAARRHRRPAGREYGRSAYARDGEAPPSVYGDAPVCGARQDRGRSPAPSRRRLSAEAERRRPKGPVGRR